MEAPVNTASDFAEGDQVQFTQKGASSQQGVVRRILKNGMLQVIGTSGEILTANPKCTTRMQRHDQVAGNTPYRLFFPDEL